MNSTIFQAKLIEQLEACQQLVLDIGLYDSTPELISLREKTIQLHNALIEYALNAQERSERMLQFVSSLYRQSRWKRDYSHLLHKVGGEK